MNNGAKFTDLSKESAVVGAIATGLFDRIPERCLIPTRAFIDDRWRIIYGAAYSLRSTGVPVCAERVSDLIAAHKLDGQLQTAIDPTKTFPWRNWPEHADQSEAFCLSTRPVEYSLEVLGELYEKREVAAVAKRMEAGELLPKEAIEALREIGRGGEKRLDLTILDERRFDFNKPPLRPEPIFKLAGQIIATAGNLVVVQSQVKSGKSAILGAMIAAAISDDPLADFLGIEAANPNGKAIVHFDTEQSRYDAHALIDRALRRAVTERPPSWLRSYCLTDVDSRIRRRLFAAEMERSAQKHGGVYAGLIDGVGDLAIDVNDTAESNGLVAELHALAIRFDCPIVCVLHENPGENPHGKTRGHLGSQLERKAESNLRLVKDTDGVTVVFSEKSRGASISKERGPRFKWNDAEKMHRSCETMRDAKTESRCIAMRALIEEIFNFPEATGGLTWAQVHERIETLEKLKRTGARRRFDNMMGAGLLEKNSAGFYLPAL